jgi:hypothetical protein
MKIQVFLVYSFHSKQGAYTRSQINAVLEESCTIAQEDLTTLGYDVEIEYSYTLDEYGGQLNNQLVGRLSNADICVVDISDNNPNVFYELGVIHALGKTAILLKSSLEQENFPLPSDISGSLFLKYKEINSIKGRLAKAILNVSQKKLDEKGMDSILRCKSFWNLPVSNGALAIIGAPSLTKTSFSNLSNWNYVYLDNLGDKDAIVDISILVGRLYPEVTLERYTSNDFPKDILEGNLIVIGGVGSDKYPGNKITKIFIDKLNIPIANDVECEKLFVGNEVLEGVYEGEPTKSPLVKDYGFFARFKNPFNPSSRVVMIFGLHTLGVLGATRCFSMHPAAKENLDLVKKELGDDPAFYTLFPVDVVKGLPVVPKLNFSIIKKIDE